MLRKIGGGEVNIEKMISRHLLEVKCQRNPLYEGLRIFWYLYEGFQIAISYVVHFLILGIMIVILDYLEKSMKIKFKKV